MVCISCKNEVDSGGAFCPNCGYELSNETVKTDQTENDLEEYLATKGYRFDSVLREKPYLSVFCYDQESNLKLVKEFDHSLRDKYERVKPIASGNPTEFCAEGKCGIVSWDAGWLRLNEWLKDDPSPELRRDLWRQTVDFVLQVHQKKMLVNYFAAETIWVNPQNNQPKFEAVEFMTFEDTKEVIVGDEAFSSPEIRDGEWETVTYHSDVYGLAKLWLYLFNNNKEILKEYRESFNLFIDLPLNQGFTLAKALRENPEDRWPSVASMKDSFDKTTELCNLQGYGFSEQGFRDLNEDSIFYNVYRCQNQKRDRNVGIFVVADGMGGLNYGEEASSFCIEFIYQKLTENLSKMGDAQTDLKNLIIETINQCNQALVGKSEQMAEKMGTTVVLAVVFGNIIRMGYVGDSRFYHFGADRKIKFVSEDHSLVGKRLAEGDITEEEALLASDKSIIYQALGLKEAIRVDCYSAELLSGEILLLCTDGISGVFTNRMIEKIFSDHEDVKTAARVLFYQAMEKGTTDNCSLIVVKGD